MLTDTTFRLFSIYLRMGRLGDRDASTVVGNVNGLCHLDDNVNAVRTRIAEVLAASVKP